MEENDRPENRIGPRDFDQVLSEIEKSSKPNTLIGEAYFAFGKIWLSIGASSFFILASLEVWRLGFSVFYPIVGTVLGLACLPVAIRSFVASNLKVKSRERIYFLKCIQASQSVNELDQLGFFRVPPCRTGEDYMKDRDNVAQKMIKTFSSRS